MDNISHSLIGVLTAESAVWLLERKSPEKTLSVRQKVCLWLAAFIGSNFPDTDIVLAAALKPQPVQYLLQHRGYSHTFLGVPFQALAITLLFYFWARFKKTTFSILEYSSLFVVALLALVLHITMDGFNIYGVHPFWPFDNHWYYGDSLFIVEPWIWLTLIPLGFFAGNSKYLRALHISFWIAGLGLIWLSHFVPLAIASGMTFWGIIMAWQMKFYSRGKRLVLSSVILILILATFVAASLWLKKGIKEQYAKESPGIQLQDIMLSPLPSNPFCWSVICLETYATRSSYRLRRGMVGALPQFYGPEECLKLFARKKIASNVTEGDRIIWTTDLKFSREELLDLQKRSCLVRAELKFLRAPFWRREGNKLTVSDMRFDLSRKGNFTTIEVDPEEKICPSWVPDWIEPRADLLHD